MRRARCRSVLSVVCACLGGLWPFGSAYCDELLGAIEFDAIPWEGAEPWTGEGEGWLVDECEVDCSQGIVGGVFRVEWPTMGEPVGFSKVLDITRGSSEFWIEWRFRSNHVRPLASTGCDARFSFWFFDVSELVDIFGDSVLSQSGDYLESGLDPKSFHVYRYEGRGPDFRFSVDGRIFYSGTDSKQGDWAYFGFGGEGGCGAQYHPVVNEWDYIRYGRLSEGAKLVGSQPPSGFVQPAIIDRFECRFDAPTFVHANDIVVETTGGAVPEVSAVTRAAGWDSTRLLVRLDQPIPLDETTRFTLPTGDVVRFTLSFGDTDGNGTMDLSDVATWQGCFGERSGAEPCAALDASRDGLVNAADTAYLINNFAGPNG